MGKRGRKPQYPNVIREVHLSNEQFEYVQQLAKVMDAPPSVVIRAMVDLAVTESNVRRALRQEDTEVALRLIESEERS
jgi:hypothetical protein